MKLKAGADDFEKCINIIKEFYSRLKHIVVMLVEVTRSLVPG